jgi:hypothetical protein
MCQDSTPPKGVVVAVPERGLKCRIVSKHDISVIQPGHAVREWLLKGLARDPRTRDVLKGHHRRAVEKAL